jgi:hypothetical protein
MTIQTPLRFLAGSVFALSLIVYGAPWSASQVALAQDQSLFVAYTDIEGASITDMEATDVIVTWDDEECEIVELEPINWPLRVTLMVDTGTEAAQFLADIRVGLESFLDALSPDIEVAIASMGGGRVQHRTEPTSDREELREGLGRVAPDRGSSAFFDGLYEVFEQVDEDKDRDYFPVVVMVAVGGAEGSTRFKGRGSQQTMDRMNASGGTVHTLLLTGVSGAGARSTGRAQSQWGNDFAVASRGSYQAISDSSLFRTKLPELAEKLNQKNTLVRHQYRITYKPPRGASDQPRIQMSTKRPGLTIWPTDNGNIQQ